MPRIIAGTAKGIPLKTPSGLSTRPTTDRVKETVFNILRPYIANAKVLDVFSGSGSLGAEALSRGAANAVFIEGDRACAGIIKENLQKTRLIDKARIIAFRMEDAIPILAKEGTKFDLIFMDPPYNRNFIDKTLHLLLENDIMVVSGIIAIEHHRDETALERFETLELVRQEKYGETCFSFYQFSDNI